MKIYEEGFEFEYTINISPLCMHASGYSHQARAKVLVNARDSERIAFNVALENVKEQIMAKNPALIKKKSILRASDGNSVLPKYC